MQLTAIFFLAICLQLSARTAGQTVSFSGTNVPLKNAFKAIEQQTGYVVLWNTALERHAKPVTVNAKNQPLKEFLAGILHDQALTYSIIKSSISIKPAPEKQLDLTGLSVDTSLTKISGTVVGMNNQPLVGATIRVKGKNIITMSDEKGYFELMAEVGSVLVVSYVGFQQRELKVRNNNAVSIELLSMNSKLDTAEVIVSTGYEQIPKERATGSFTFLTEKQLNTRIAPDIISKLDGITNGLTFNKDPYGGTDKIRVRGESTIFANPNPLIVVDNFPFDGAVSNINPNDIYSITILKDAAAASIWGVEAGNGVIVITTKKGRINQPLRVDVNANLTIKEKPDLFYASRITPSDYIEIEQKLFGLGYYDGSLGDPNKPALSPVIEILNSLKNGMISEEEALKNIDVYRNYDLRNDEKKFLYRNAIHQQYSINFSGGTNRTTYYFSAGFDKDLNAVKGNTDNRFTLNSQNTFTPLKGLDFLLGINYAQSKNLLQGVSKIANAFPYTRLVDAEGNQLSIPQRRAEFEDTIESKGFHNWKYFPLIDRSLNSDKTRIFDTRLTTGIKYSLIKDVNAEIIYQYQRSSTNYESIAGRQSYTIRDRMNAFAILDNDGNYIGSNFPDGSLMKSSSSELSGHYGRANIRINKSWNRNNISGLAGFEAREIKTENHGTTLYGFNEETGSFIIPDYYQNYILYPSNSIGTIGNPQSDNLYSATTNRFRSYFANASWSYASRYIISASGRLDGSNYFGVKTNRKTVPLWSTGLKWEISKESFFNADFVNDLGVRISYGFNGNLAQNVAAVTTLEYLGNATYTGLPFARVNNIPNPQLRWEKIGQLNIGLDYALWNNRLNGSIEYYTKRGNDMIGDAPIDPTTGVSQLRGNFSGLKAGGIDVMLDAKPVKNKNVEWGTSLIFNFVTDKVTKYDLPVLASTLIDAYGMVIPLVGKPLYSLFSYKYAGLDELSGAPKGIIGDTVSMNYLDFSSDKLKFSDLTFSGRYNPKYFGSLLNNITWKNLTLAINIKYKFGYNFRRNSINYTSIYSTDWSRIHNDFADRWQKPGDEVYTKIPSWIYPNDPARNNLYAFSDYLVEKGDHIRLQYINLSYTFNRNQLSAIPFSNLQIYLYVNDLGIIWRANKKGIDPDYPYISAPPSRTWSFGIRANF